MVRLEKQKGLFLKYALYEASVQSTEPHLTWFVHVHRELIGRFPSVMREDFCGTFKISADWVSRNRANYAIGIDLDPEPLTYGRAVNLSKLKPKQRQRLKLMQADVLKVKPPRKIDLAVACNFSFNIFHERETLLKYFKNVFKSLGKEGIFILEAAGGPGMIQKIREQRTITRRGGQKFTYIWDQRSFDPIHRNGKYSIHFRLPDGRKLNHAFTYDWRMWTIPELRDVLVDAGFPETVVYWEPEDKSGRGTGEYMPSERGDNAHSWIAYVVGVKRKNCGK